MTVRARICWWRCCWLADVRKQRWARTIDSLGQGVADRRHSIAQRSAGARAGERSWGIIHAAHRKLPLLHLSHGTVKHQAHGADRVARFGANDGAGAAGRRDLGALATGGRGGDAKEVDQAVAPLPVAARRGQGLRRRQQRHLKAGILLDDSPNLQRGERERCEEASSGNCLVSWRQLVLGQQPPSVSALHGELSTGSSHNASDAPRRVRAESEPSCLG